MLNERPSTHESSEFNDEEPLTSSHLLYGRRITTLPHPLYEEGEIGDPSYKPKPNNIEAQEKLISHLIQHFWKRWRQEYLTATFQYD